MLDCLHPNLSKTLKTRIWASQNNFIPFCLPLDKCHIHLKNNLKQSISCASKKGIQWETSIVFKYFGNQCRHYVNEVCIKGPKSTLSLRNSCQKLKQLLRKTSIGRNALFCIGPSLSKKIPEEIKRTTNLNTFKHCLKKNYLKEVGKS